MQWYNPTNRAQYLRVVATYCVARFQNVPPCPFALLSYQDIDGEGHDEARDEEVGHGEGDDEEVGDVLQELLPTHRQDDEHVPEDHNHAQLKFK